VSEVEELYSELHCYYQRLLCHSLQRSECGSANFRSAKIFSLPVLSDMLVFYT